MPLSRSLSMSSLPGLEDWEDEFDPENAVLFEVAWEVANKGENVSVGPLTKEGSEDGGPKLRFRRGKSYVEDSWVLGKAPVTSVSLWRGWSRRPRPWGEGTRDFS